MIAGPVLPVRPTEAPSRTKDVVAGTGSWTILFLKAAVLADGYDRGAAAIHDCGLAKTGIEGNHRGSLCRPVHRRGSDLVGEAEAGCPFHDLR